MNCKYFQDLLIQLPYHELNREEISLLENHLKGCETCRAELKDNEQLMEFSKILRESIPSDKNQQESIQHILKEINNSFYKPNFIRNIGEITLKPNFLFRAFQIAINVAALFLIGLFLIQQLEIKKELENLQSKIAIQGIMFRQKRLPVDIKEFTNLSDDQIEHLIKEYDELLKENSTILSFLRINYPEIYREIQQNKSIERNPLQNL